MIPFGPVVARTRVTAPRAAVWEYLVDSTHRANWWSEVRFEPAVGSKIAEHREIEGDEQGRAVEGEIDVFVRGHAIGFTWHESDEPDTSVLLTLRSHGDETGITVTETGFDALPSPAEKSAAALADWRGLLESFTIAVEQAVADGFAVESEAEEQIDFDADSEETESDTDDAESGADEADEPDSDDEDVDADTVVVEIPGTDIEPVEELEIEIDEDEEVQTSDSEMIEVEPDEIPLVLPAPPENHGASESEDRSDEPDFDALVRGD